MANNDLIVKLITLLETALNVTSDPRRGVVYAEAMEDLSEVQIRHAFKRAVKEWHPEYGRVFPSPAELREYADDIDSTPATSIAPGAYANPPFTCDPDKLPKGWTMQEWQRAKMTLWKCRH